jgi:hypothetical protein
LLPLLLLLLLLLFTRAASGVITTTVSTLNFEDRSSYLCNVSVSDGGLPTLTHVSTVLITIQNVNDPPVWLDCNVSSAAGPCRTATVPENVPTGTPLSLTSALVAVDEDGDPLSFTLSSAVPTPVLPFALLSSSVPSVVASALVDFEAMAWYTLAVSVTDGRSSAVVAGVAVTVTNVNEPPVFPPALTSSTIQVPLDAVCDSVDVDVDVDVDVSL